MREHNLSGFTRRYPTIYIIDGSVAMTGAFVCARNMARALDGHARTVLVLPLHANIAPELLRDFAEVRYLPIRPLRRKVGAILQYLPALLASSFMLRRMMRIERADLLIVNDFYLMQGVVCRLLGFRGKIYTWVRINPKIFGNILSTLWLRASNRVSNRMIAVSQFISDILRPEISACLLYDGLYPLLPPGAPATLPYRFVYCGNYIEGKGQDIALEAFASIASNFPETELHFYGGDMGYPRNQAYRMALAERVAKLRLNERVYLHGFAPQPAEILNGALASLNFSQSESFSLTVLEAQGAGIPVIATRSGGPAEIIEDGKTGILVNVGDVGAMTAAMRRLIEDKKLAATMGAAARERVIRCFSHDSFSQKLLDLLQYS